MKLQMELFGCDLAILARSFRPRVSLFPGLREDCWPSHSDWQFVSPLRTETASLCPLPKCVVQAQCTKSLHSMSLINLGGVKQMNNLPRITNESKPSAMLAPSSLCLCYLQRSGPQSRAHPQPEKTNRSNGTQAQDWSGRGSQPLLLTSYIHLGKFITLLKLQFLHLEDRTEKTTQCENKWDIIYMSPLHIPEFHTDTRSFQCKAPLKCGCSSSYDSMRYA